MTTHWLTCTIQLYSDSAHIAFSIVTDYLIGTASCSGSCNQTARTFNSNVPVILCPSCLGKSTVLSQPGKIIPTTRTSSCVREKQTIWVSIVTTSSASLWMMLWIVLRQPCKQSHWSSRTGTPESPALGPIHVSF